MLRSSWRRFACSPSALSGRVSHLFLNQSRTVANRTFRHQSELPRLVIPDLNDTCDRYLEQVAPLISDKALENTTECVDWFRGKSGQLLHKKLQELDEESSASWLEGFWDTMYLEYRAPVPIHSNPFFILSDLPTDKGSQGQIQRASNALYATLKFARQIREKNLEPDMEGGKPLCMSQYSKLFGCSRIPFAGRDQLSTSLHARHIVVMRNGHMYTLPVFDKNSNILPLEQINAKLSGIIQDADALPTDDDDGSSVGGVGVLTTLQRDEWAAARGHLVSDDNNRMLIDKVDSALLVLCLDSENSATMHDSSERFLHNFGENRWFDKLQLIVEKNGRCGINMEHSPIDGQTVLRLANEVHQDNSGVKPIALDDEHVPAESLEEPERLQWKLHPETINSITAAARSFDALVDTTQTSVLPFTAFGKDTIKSFKCSPDAFVQMAYQLAYFRLHRRMGSTYESCSTKNFLHGRTETIRSVSAASSAFCRGFDIENKSASRELMNDALQQQVAVSKMAKAGLGVDRHLFGMHCLARHQQQRIAGYKIPAIFQDPAYETFTSNVLSTSNCGSDAMQLFGFGPVHPKGLGIGYMIHANSISVNVTSFRQEAEDFTESLEEALVDMAEVCK